MMSSHNVCLSEVEAKREKCVWECVYVCLYARVVWAWSWCWKFSSIDLHFYLLGQGLCNELVPADGLVHVGKTGEPSASVSNASVLVSLPYLPGFYLSLRIWIQALIPARQILYPLSYLPNPHVCPWLRKLSVWDATFWQSYHSESPLHV